MMNSMDKEHDHTNGNVESTPEVADWIDGNGRVWRVAISTQGITVTSDEQVIEVSADALEEDVYVAEHGSGFIVRIETFECSVGFVLTAEQAQPIVDRIGIRRAESATATDEPDTPSDHTALLWPKVSPIAVGALFCSTLTFVPVLGLIPALATVALLVIHRRQVHRAVAYRHSRLICMCAFAIMLVGLIVSAIGMWGMANNATRGTAPPTPYMRRAALERPDPSAISNARTVVAQSSIVERKHNWGLLVAALVVVLLSLTVHEAAHAVTAWWLGDDFGQRLGRVTLNPLAHIDPFGTILLPLILFLAGAGVFGWARPVPVRLDHVPRPRRAHILISLAGPGSNLLLAAIALMLLIGVGGVVGMVAPGATIADLTALNFTQVVTASGFALSPVVGPLCTILKLAFLINVLLAFFNLIPIPPLDGSWVLEHLFPRTLGPIYERIRPYAFLLFLGLIYSNAIVHLLTPAWIALAIGFDLLDSCTIV